jgi:hypothetical protein
MQVLLIEKVLEFLRPARMPKLPQRFGFYLADAFTGDVELPSHLL